eukprot:1160093-Pelagomonas_calceolata.AAC.14
MLSPTTQTQTSILCNKGLFLHSHKIMLRSSMQICVYWEGEGLCWRANNVQSRKIGCVVKDL